MLAPFLVIGCMLAGEPANDAALKTEVLKLVHKLDADTEKERTEAKKGLIQLGPAVLDLLPSPESQPNDEIANSIRRVRQQLQETLAARSLEASTVTLHGRLRTSKVLAEIQKQTGNTIADLPRAAGAAIADPEIVVNFDKTPFWTALDSALDQAQLSIYPYGQPHALKIVPRGPNDLPRTGRAAIQGPMRIEPVTVLAKRELRSSSPPALQVSLEVAWEPRLQPIAIKQRMAGLKILDSSGGSVATDDPQAEKEASPGSGSSAVEMDIALAVPAQPLKEISSLTGSVQAMLLGKVEEFRFVDLLKGKQEKRIVAATVTLDEVRKNGDSWEIFVRLRFDSAGDALESHRNWVVQNEAHLEDADGKPIQPDSMETTLRTKNEVGVGYVFAMPDLPKNLAFVYKTPGMVVTKDFRYELKGIKMP
ncbi:MAG: hypothetical protein ACLP9L_12880 [Thermoguttaceae bacterium]